MFKLKAMKRICAAVACAVLAIGAVTQTVTYTKPISAQSESELNATLADNKEKINDLQSQLDGYSKKQKDSEEYQAVLQQKMDVQKDNLAILDEEVRRLKNDISDKQVSIDNLANKIKVQEQAIAEGMDDFKQRLRAIYVTGNDSMASALVGSTDFYDMLSKYELMSRVAKYDNDLVNELKSDLNEYAASKKSLETQKIDLKSQVNAKTQKREEMQGALDDLSSDYQNTEDAKNEAKLQADVTQDQISDYEQAQDEMESEIASQQAEIQEAESEKASEKAENNIPNAPGAETSVSTVTEPVENNSKETETETDTTDTEVAPNAVIADGDNANIDVDDNEVATDSNAAAPETETVVTEAPKTELATTTTTETKAEIKEETIQTEAPETESDTKITQSGAETVETSDETQTKATEPATETDSSEESSEEESASETESSTEKTTTAPETEATTETTTTTADDNNTSFAWPTSGFTISSGFGYRWGSLHKGLDLAAPMGTPITASRSGTVVAINNTCTHNYPKSSSCGCGGGYGNYVVISHDGTYSTLYGHMSTVNVSVGQTVSQGQQIGTVGTTGFSTGAHCHFEVHVNGTAVDPAKYLY